MGEWISTFMAEIGRSQCVVVVLSEKYLKSRNCMRELLYLYHAAQADKQAMLKRIVPVVMPDASIGTIESRLKYAKHWTDRYVELDKSREGLDDLSQGNATRDERLLIADFKHHVVDMLTWVNDVLIPRAGRVSSETLTEVVIQLAKDNITLNM